jgi:16S rRNA (cytidine1402-2'-O)-methyltransferase
MSKITSLNQPAILYLVGTPIGNLQDLSPRAVNILKSCDLILAEDTRHSIYLLKNFDIHTPLKSYHQHNEVARSQEILELLKQNNKVALITDAGMPTISDPGYIITKLALENNIRVSVVPGPSAISSAISVSGIDCRKFCFEGFLSSKEQGRRKELEELVHESRSIVLYEAPHRIKECLADILLVFGEERMMAAVKELTKQYETVYHGTVKQVFDELSQIENIKGEFVIVISGTNKAKNHSEQEVIQALALLQEENISLKQSVKIISQLYNLKKNYVYDLAIRS